MKKIVTQKKDPIMLCDEKKYHKVRQIVFNSAKEPDKNFNVEFNQDKESYGWIDINISSASYKTTIETSNVFDPYFDFVWWLEAIYLNKLPQIWAIDFFIKNTLKYRD